MTMVGDIYEIVDSLEARLPAHTTIPQFFPLFDTRDSTLWVNSVIAANAHLDIPPLAGFASVNEWAADVISRNERAIT
jgi:hypothetical protein